MKTRCAHLLFTTVAFEEVQHGALALSAHIQDVAGLCADAPLLSRPPHADVRPKSAPHNPPANCTRHRNNHRGGHGGRRGVTRIYSIPPRTCLLDHDDVLVPLALRHSEQLDLQGIARDTQKYKDKQRRFLQTKEHVKVTEKCGLGHGGGG